MKLNKKTLVIAGCTLLTLANGAGLGYAIMQHSKKPTPAVALQQIVKPKVDITNAKKRDADPKLLSTKLGTGTYKSETLKKSKITEGTSAKLAIATNEQSGGHFVLAFLDKGNIPAGNQLESGWTLQAIADDPMWAPGACSSKPTFLIQDKYIFIDDGKTKPEDTYNSYIIFNMQTTEYHYLGGSNFTETQGKKERILLTANENDKLVFYIDPVDDQPYLQDNSTPGHIKGKDKAYIIRREIDPVTFDYTDYSLPFSVPSDLTNYYVSAYTSGNKVAFGLTAPYLNGIAGPSYDGTLEGNVIKLAPSPPPSYSNNYDPSHPDLALDLSLDGTLRKTLSALTDQKPYDGSQYKTLFSTTELGSYQQLQFLDVAQRYPKTGTSETYSTPLIYDKGSSQAYPMVTKPILRHWTDYINLGVF